jgi:hypothetical protein
MTSGTERRRSPRSLVEMPVTLAIGDTAEEISAPASVQDVSLSGVRCVTKHAVGIMTQVGLTLVIPNAGAGSSIAARGAVVRSQRIGVTESDEALYETAIFFTSMAENDRMALQEFLLTMQELTGD